MISNMAKKKYSIYVVFTTTIDVDVKAEDLDDAMAEAEDKASKEFEKLLNEGYLGTSDFTCEAQMP